MAAGLHAEAIRLQVSSYEKQTKKNRGTIYNVEKQGISGKMHENE